MKRWMFILGMVGGLGGAAPAASQETETLEETTRRVWSLLEEGNFLEEKPMGAFRYPGPRFFVVNLEGCQTSPLFHLFGILGLLVDLGHTCSFNKPQYDAQIWHMTLQTLAVAAARELQGRYPPPPGLLSEYRKIYAAVDERIKTAADALLDMAAVEEIARQIAPHLRTSANATMAWAQHLATILTLLALTYHAIEYQYTYEELAWTYTLADSLMRNWILPWIRCTSLYEQIPPLQKAVASLDRIDMQSFIETHPDHELAMRRIAFEIVGWVVGFSAGAIIPDPGVLEVLLGQLGVAIAATGADGGEFLFYHDIASRLFALSRDMLRSGATSQEEAILAAFALDQALQILDHRVIGKGWISGIATLLPSEENRFREWIRTVYPQTGLHRAATSALRTVDLSAPHHVCPERGKPDPGWFTVAVPPWLLEGETGSCTPPTYAERKEFANFVRRYRTGKVAWNHPRFQELREKVRCLCQENPFSEMCEMTVNPPLP